MNFFETRAGYNFTTHTIPMLVQAIEDATKVQKAQIEAMEENTRALKLHTQTMEQYIAMMEKQPPKTGSATSKANTPAKPDENSTNLLSSNFMP